MSVSVTVTIDTGQVRAMVQPGGIVSNDMQRRANNVLSRSRLLAPVDTGRLRASGLVEPSSDSSVEGAWDVAYPVNYALYVNSGTRWVSERPFLSDALQAAV